MDKTTESVTAQLICDALGGDLMVDLREPVSPLSPEQDSERSRSSPEKSPNSAAVRLPPTPPSPPPPEEFGGRTRPRSRGCGRSEKNKPWCVVQFHSDKKTAVYATEKIERNRDNKVELGGCVVVNANLKTYSATVLCVADTWKDAKKQERNFWDEQCGSDLSSDNFDITSEMEDRFDHTSLVLQLEDDEEPVASSTPNGKTAAKPKEKAKSAAEKVIILRINLVFYRY